MLQTIKRIMKGIYLFILFACIFVTLSSCSNEELKSCTQQVITKNVVVPDTDSDEAMSALEKTLSYIDNYNKENSLFVYSGTIKFVTKIDNCPSEIIQWKELNSNAIIQKITTNCRVKTVYKDNYLKNPDYLSRHYTRKLVVARSEMLSTAVRRYSSGVWSEWTYKSYFYDIPTNLGKNIAFFGGSFAHNVRDKGTNAKGFGFYHNGEITSLQNFIADIFASKYTGNYAQSGQGVYTGCHNGKSNTYFHYNMYEQVKYAFEFSQENDFDYDLFLLFGGINDCYLNVPIGNINDPAGDNSYIASFKKTIELIKRNNPNASIYLLTSFPVFSDSPYYDLLDRYVQANIELAQFYELPIFDIFNSGIFTETNYAQYYLFDDVHPNRNGYCAVASYIVDLISD